MDIVFLAGIVISIVTVLGGLVALLLAFRPRGILDERLVHRLKTRR